MDGVIDTPVLGSETAIVGENQAGEAAKARRQCQALIKSMHTSAFDLMDVLYEIREKRFYQPKFTTYVEFAKSLDLKLTKIYYLTRIRESMATAGITREKYEPIGIAKLRVIASIDLVKDGQVDQVAVTKVNEIVDMAATAEPEAVRAAVAEFKGDVGEEAWTWINVKVRESQKAVIIEAIELCKMQIGSTGTDAGGEATDASDGRALELICADFLADPNQALYVHMKGDDDQEVTTPVLPTGQVQVPELQKSIQSSSTPYPV